MDFKFNRVMNMFRFNFVYDNQADQSKQTWKLERPKK